MNTDTAPTDINEIGPPTSEPEAPPPANYFEDIPPASPPPPEPAETTAETKARKTRSTWPIRIFRCADGGMFPVPNAPEFSEAADARTWMTANTPAGEMYMPARHPEKAFRQTLKLEEVSPW